MIGNIVMAEKKKIWILLVIAALMAGFSFVCTGCMYEEINDNGRTIRRYHGILTPESIRLYIGGQVDSTDSHKANQKSTGDKSRAK
jgi:hypothetical protein